MISYVELSSWAKVLYLQTKNRATRKGMLFTLTKEEFAKLVDESDCRCAVTGIQFEDSPPVKRHGKRAFAASIDRRDSAIGYTAENCRLVCVAANLAMNWWGEEVLVRMAVGLIAKRGGDAMWRKEGAGLRTLEGVKVRAGKHKVSYTARISQCGRETHLGTFSSEAEANAAYLAAKAILPPERPPTNNFIGRRDWTRTNASNESSSSEDE